MPQPPRCLIGKGGGSVSSVSHWRGVSLLRGGGGGQPPRCLIGAGGGGGSALLRCLIGEGVEGGHPPHWSTSLGASLEGGSAS